MAEYLVNIRMTEDYWIAVEADNSDNAVSEAFNYRYAWARKDNVNPFEVYVKECVDE